MIWHRDATGAGFGRPVRRWTRLVRMAAWAGARLAPRRAPFKRKPKPEMWRSWDANPACGGDPVRGRHEAKRYAAWHGERRSANPAWQYAKRSRFGGINAGLAPRRFGSSHGVALKSRAAWNAGTARPWTRRRLVETVWRKRGGSGWDDSAGSRLVGFKMTTRFAEPKRFRTGDAKRAAGSRRIAASGFPAHPIAPARNAYSWSDAGLYKARADPVKDWGSRDDFARPAERWNKAGWRGSESAGEAGREPASARTGMTPQPHDMTRWLGDLFADEARRPPSGVTGFDSRLSPIFPGRKPGF